jgi:hypothetical protein
LTSPLRREWRPKFDVGTFRLSAHRDALKLEKLPLAVGSGLPPVGDVDLSGQDEDNQCLSRFVLHPRRLPGGATLTNWSPGDPQLLFPAAEGHQGAASDTYYASGILRGESSGRRYAFLTIFAKNEDIFHLLSADLHVLALFDLDVGTYDTGSRFDLPPRRQRNLERINVTRGRLEVSYTSNRRVSLMRGRTDGGGGFHPFAYEFDLSAEARSGTEMALRLCADALKPPQAVGGSVYGGRITVYGQANTYSYFQVLGYAGTLRWGETEEAVSGRIGWLDRQWFPEYAGRYAGVLADRFGHQWAQISLDNGWEFSLWRQFRRREHDRQVMFSGLTATDPAGLTIFADDG